MLTNLCVARRTGPRCRAPHRTSLRESRPRRASIADPIALAFNQGRVRDVTTVKELVIAYKAQPGGVLDWLGEGEPAITRGAVKLLGAFLGKKFGQEESPAVEEGSADRAPQMVTAEAPAYGDTGHRRWRCGSVVVLHQQREAVLLLGRRPGAEGRVWIRHEDGVEVEIALAEVRPLRLLGAGE